MTHYGLICPAATGHLNTMLPLGKELQRRGHRVTLFGILDMQTTTQAAGLAFKSLGEAAFPQGSMAQVLSEIGKLRGMTALQRTIRWVEHTAEVFLRELPQALKTASVDALVIDQVAPGAGAVADWLDIPFITLCSAVVVNRDDTIPPVFTTWGYNTAWWAIQRNRLTYAVLERMTQPIRDVVNNARRAWKLPPYATPDDGYSRLAQISQQPADLEFPRQQLPRWFHFTGPYHSLAGRPTTDFPWEKLTGQPLIYASMGTIQNRLWEIFYTIAEACVGLEAQLVISLGGSTTPEALPHLPGTPLVVDYAPQLALLNKATLTLTHAGMNTTLESLHNAVPMVAIPVTNDQPGVSARIVWSGCGESVTLKKLNVVRLRAALAKVLTDTAYTQHAVRLQTAIHQAGGVSRAADIIEQVISTGKSVLAQVNA